jgi:hypothetical protein
VRFSWTKNALKNAVAFGVHEKNMAEVGEPEGVRPPQPQHTRRRRDVGIISQSIPVPFSTVPFLLGRGGGTVKKISHNTGCTLHISEQPETALGCEWRYVSIRGSVAGVNAAKKFLILYVHRHGQLNPQEPVESEAPAIHEAEEISEPEPQGTPRS